MEFASGIADPEETNDAVLELSQLEEAFSSTIELGSSPINLERTELGNPGSSRVQVSASSSFPPPSDGIARQTQIPQAPPPVPTNEIRTVRIPTAMPISRSVEENLQPAVEEEEQVRENLQLAVEEAEQVSEKSSCKWTFPVILDLVVSVFFVGCLIASLTVHVIKNYMIWGLELWKWCVLFMVVFCIPFNKLMMKVVVFVIERFSVCNEKVLYYVYALRKSVQVLVWVSCVLLAWWLLFDEAVKRSKRTTQILNYITMSLASLLIGAALWAVKTLVMEISGSSFRVTRFLDRIQRSILDQHILEVFSQCTESMLRTERERVKSKTKTYMLIKKLQKQNDNEKVIGWLMEMKSEKVSAWTMKMFIEMITDSGLSMITNELEKSFGEQDDNKISDEVNNVVKKIFKRIQNSGSTLVNLWDLREFFGDETNLVLQRINGAAGKLSFNGPVLKNWLVNATVGRTSLAQSLNESKRELAELEKIVSGIVITLSIIFWLLLMEILTIQVFVLILTQFFVLAFIFGNTARSVFEGIIFVFVTHPFVKGDYCLVQGEEMIVEEINLLTTVFRKNGKDRILYPNCVLATLPIRNFPENTINVRDYVELAIDSSTLPKEIRKIEGRIQWYLVNSQHWHRSHSIVLKNIDYENKMKMVLYVTHLNINIQNYEDMMSKRRSELVNVLKEIFKNQAIEYYYIQPQDVSLKVSAMVH